MLDVLLSLSTIYLNKQKHLISFKHSCFLSCEKCIFQLTIGWFCDRSWLCHNSLRLISHLIFTLTPLPQGHLHPVVSYKKKNKTRFPLCLILCATLHAACPNSPYKLQWGTQQPITTSCLLNEAGVGHMLPSAFAPTLATSFDCMHCNTVHLGARGIVETRLKHVL